MDDPRTAREFVADTSTEGERPRALVVDDSEAQVLACTRVLEKHGYRVEAAHSARSALVALERGSFNVLVSDIHMPDMSGMELLTQARARGFDIPAVLVTGNPTVDSAMQAMEHGIVRYLAKPVAPGALVTAVNNVVRLHGLARAERLAMDNEALRSLVEELHRSKDAAMAGTRAKAEFLSKIGHELRTPMSGVIGYAELALATDLPPEGREHLEGLWTAANSLMQILADVLELAAMDAGRAQLKPEPFSVREVLAAVLKPMLPTAEAKRLSVTTDVGSGVPDVLLGDRTKFGQIVKALVGNAIKFTEAGEVRIVAHLEANLGREVQLCVSISDTGIGIPPESLARVLEPFSQEDDSPTRRFGGAGLGLTIASQLVALMNGSFKLDSTPKVGTTVRFTVCLERVPVDDGFFIVDSHPSGSMRKAG